jgi:hypothetical protein
VVRAAPKKVRIDAGRAGLVAVSISLLTLTACTPVSQPDKTAELDRAYLGNLSKSWGEFYNVKDPPQIEPVRFIGTEEVDSVHRDCLIEAGYDRNAVGLITVPEGQESVFGLAEYTCRMQYPVPEKFTQEWSTKQIHKQYVWTTEFVVPCLESSGHPVEGVPSESVFVESWDNNPFFPFSQVRVEGAAQQYNEAWAVLEAECPQIAPGEVLWDDLGIEEWVARRP